MPSTSNPYLRDVYLHDIKGLADITSELLKKGTPNASEVYTLLFLPEVKTSEQ